MFFTREDIEKIHQGLLRFGIKDSELPETINVNSDDTLAVVQDGKNKKINIEEFLNNISLFKKEGFINITDRFNKHSMSLMEAIQTVPTHQRIDGLVITFEDINGDWRIYQFRGDAVDFFAENKWTDLYDYTNYIVKSITPDEEDLTVSKPDKNGNAIVSLKDRVYSESDFSGKGYKILRKNIQTIDGIMKNILTQDMIINENTIYEIRYDFDLNNETIVLPKNCRLRFNGGSINNGHFDYTALGHVVVKAQEVGFIKGVNIRIAAHNGGLFSDLISSGVGIDFGGGEYRLKFKSTISTEYVYIINGILNLDSTRDSIFNIILGSRRGHIELSNTTFNSTSDALKLFYQAQLADNYFDVFSIKDCTFNNVQLIRMFFADYNPSIHKCGASRIIIENNNINNLTGTFLVLSDMFYGSCTIRGNNIKNAKYSIFYFGITNEFTNFHNSENGTLLFEDNIHRNDDDFLCESNHSNYICTLLSENYRVVMKNNIFQNIRAYNSLIYAFYVSSVIFECSNNIIKNVFNFNECTNPIIKTDNLYNEIFKSKYATGDPDNPGYRIFANNKILLERDNYIAAMKLSIEFPEDYAYYDTVMLLSRLFSPVDYMNVKFINNDINIEGVLVAHSSTVPVYNFIFNNNTIKFWNTVSYAVGDWLIQQKTSVPLFISKMSKKTEIYEIKNNVFTCTNTEYCTMLYLGSSSGGKDDGGNTSVIIENNRGNNVALTFDGASGFYEKHQEILNRRIVYRNNISLLLKNCTINVNKFVNIPSTEKVVIDNCIPSTKYTLYTKDIKISTYKDKRVSYILHSEEYREAITVVPKLDTESECYLVKYTKENNESKVLEIYKENNTIRVSSDTTVDKKIVSYDLSKLSLYLYIKEDIKNGGVIISLSDETITIVDIIGRNGRLDKFSIEYSPVRANLRLVKGNTADRPIISSDEEGFRYYDTTLKKYIVWNGTEWTNMDGTTL